MSQLLLYTANLLYNKASCLVFRVLVSLFRYQKYFCIVMICSFFFFCLIQPSLYPIIIINIILLNPQQDFELSSAPCMICNSYLMQQYKHAFCVARFGCVVVLFKHASTNQCKKKCIVLTHYTVRTKW